MSLSGTLAYEFTRVTDVSRLELYLRSYPTPDGMREHAAAVEEDGWDGLLFTDSQNLSMDVFASLYLSPRLVGA